MTNSNSISILPHLRNSEECGLYFVCGTCKQSTFVTIRRGEAGIELSDSIADSSLPKWLRPKVCLVRTRQGSLLISCEYCRSGKTVVEVLNGADGISSFLASFDRREGGDRRKRATIYFARRSGKKDRRKPVNISERLDYFNGTAK